MTQRCVLVIPDAGPINSLWVADALPLLLKLAMDIVVIDEVYEELTSDPVNYRKDREVKEFIEGHPDVFTIEKTTVGRITADARKRGEDMSGRGLGEAAIAEFFKTGIEKYARGEVSAAQLSERNGFFSVLDRSKAKLLVRRARVRIDDK